VSLIFRDGQWETFTVDPGESTLGTLVVQDQKSSGTAGGAGVATTWTTAVLNTSVANSITDSSLASNKITLPAGTYRVHAHKVFNTTEASQIRWKTADDDSIIIRGNVVKAGETDDAGNNNFNARSGVTATLMGRFTISEATDFVLQYYITDNEGESNTSLGFPATISSTNDV